MNFNFFPQSQQAEKTSSDKVKLEETVLQRIYFVIHFIYRIRTSIFLAIPVALKYDLLAMLPTAALIGH